MFNIIRKIKRFVAFFGLNEEQKSVLSEFEKDSTLFLNSLKLFALYLSSELFGISFDFNLYYQHYKKNKLVKNQAVNMAIKPWRLKLLNPEDS